MVGFLAWGALSGMQEGLAQLLPVSCGRSDPAAESTKKGLGFRGRRAPELLAMAFAAPFPLHCVPRNC